MCNIPFYAADTQDQAPVSRVHFRKLAHAMQYDSTPDSPMRVARISV